ncbi:NAD(P)-dependent alcohol dehydrogenase [Roseibacterium sp. SDUM158017]|uniref:NAD(P)-dependent alcohol dehydrogenase n=1 Tax=Roseicyclus salinarum TaxID=3036773 RepID=UPI0024151D66|nr:NAD(P)-dependent alcohol dehydrogenase [Roseibacterium sp. SDUM158017]MDG4649483.1 NAD(P)-dependent alcohol dehydrogenase [Roseibacterium sp. SDUM158017]
MKAAIHTRYGGPEVVSLGEIDRPVPRRGEILVRVGAAGVTTADWRIRAAAFPGLVSLVGGRLMFGVFRPRKPVLGGEYAGTVVETGPGVTDFAPGDRVFGFAWGGAHAEYVAVKAAGPVFATPPGLDDAEAASLPFGGLCALEFLERFAALKPGERVLILGASGGVGVHAVQVARALGARVTGVASAPREDLVRALGAEHFIDYRAPGPRGLGGPYDVIFDTIGVLNYPDAAGMLAEGGRFVPLNFGVGDIVHVRRASRNGHRLILKVSGDSKEGLARLAAMVAEGRLRPIIDRVYPFAEVRAAHRHVESRSRKGSVVLRIGDAEAGRDAA